MYIEEKVLLNTLLALHKEAEITVKGISMEPTLHEGDTIRIAKGSYRPGDILVFPYKNRELLVHRYVGERCGRLLCKGDNAFRLEDVAAEDVIGKVIGLSSEGMTYELPTPPQELIDTSYQVGKLFRRNGYNIALTKETQIYQQFMRMTAEYAVFRNPYKKE